jgi:hypothetical protein
MPIIDYHCHLSPAEVAADRRWENLAQLWLAGDHYKWRAMRTNGIDEECITGSATDRDKFRAFAATMPYLLRNPLFDWAQLELARYFGITHHPLARHGRRHLGAVRRNAGQARLLGAGFHGAQQCEGGLHHRRSHRHARTPCRGTRKRIFSPHAARLAAGQGAAD